MVSGKKFNRITMFSTLFNENNLFRILVKVCVKFGFYDKIFVASSSQMLAKMPSDNGFREC